MSKRADAALEASFGRRRPAEAIAADMQTTVLGEAAAQVQAPQMIPLTQLVTSEYQPRKINREHVNQLAESIGKNAEGLLTPIIVRPLPAGADGQPRYEIIAGHHRVAAVEQLGNDRIPAVVKPLSNLEAAAALTAENMVRKDLADYELYKTIVMLRKLEEHISDSKLARLLGFARTKIRGLGDFADLPEAAHLILEKRPDLIGYNLMAKLAPYCKSHPMFVLEAIEKLESGEVKDQAGVPGWIERKIAKEAGDAARSPRERIWKEGGKAIRLTWTDTSAKLSGDLDYDKVHQLIEANLANLRRE